MDEEGRKEFGRYIRTLRSAAKVSQKDAAEQSGISAPYLAQLERGQRNPPSRKVLTELAKTYNVAPKELWKRAEEADKRLKLKTADPERLEWAFQAACNDPTFTYGHRANAGPLTIYQKAFFVELYEKSTGRHLLTEDEKDGIEIIEPEEEERGDHASETE